MDNWSFSWDLLLRASVLLFASYLAYHFLLGGQSDFVIRLRHGRVEYNGRFPLTHQPEVTQLLLHDLGLKESAKITGSWSGGRVRLWFRGKLSKAEKQRIRNFLATRL
jgi:hypothetical protein